jgi:hypothetical protein
LGEPMGELGGPVEAFAGDGFGVVCRGMLGDGEDGAAPGWDRPNEARASTSEGRWAKRRMLRRN